MTCDECRSEQVEVSVHDVAPHGPRAVFTCSACGLAWITTKPTVVEELIVAAHRGEGS